MYTQEQLIEFDNRSFKEGIIFGLRQALEKCEMDSVDRAFLRQTIERIERDSLKAKN